MKRPIYDGMTKYMEHQYRPWHMPGHKRKNIMEPFDLFSYDVTEAEGLDNLACPEEFIREALDDATAIYHTKQTLYLVNGSTVGILTAIHACCNRGDKILISRNCHQAVYHAIELLELKPVYLIPQISNEHHIQGCVTVKSVEEAFLMHSDLKAVVIVSPTYEGVISNIEGISNIVHRNKSILIVDEAHGAHLPFISPDKSAIYQGADLVIQSLHKTLPSVTQTALLHVCTDTISVNQVKRFLQYFQTSSPSYPFMICMDDCIHWMNSDGGKLRATQYCEALIEFREWASCLTHIRLLEEDDFKIDENSQCSYDFGKLCFVLNDTVDNGMDVAHALWITYKQAYEMAFYNGFLLMTSIMDTKEDFEKLKEALLALDAEVRIGQKEDDISIYEIKERVVISPGSASGMKKEWIAVSNANGHIAGDYLYLYPPGIPILVPGEEISERLITYITGNSECMVRIQGIHDGQICVIME